MQDQDQEQQQQEQQPEQEQEKSLFRLAYTVRSMKLHPKLFSTSSPIFKHIIENLQLDKTISELPNDALISDDLVFCWQEECGGCGHLLEKYKIDRHNTKEHGNTASAQHKHVGLCEYKTCKHMCHICGQIIDLDTKSISTHRNNTCKGDGPSGKEYLEKYIKDTRPEYKSLDGFILMTPTQLKKLVDNKTIRRAKDIKTEMEPKQPVAEPKEKPKAKPKAQFGYIPFTAEEEHERKTFKESKYKARTDAYEERQKLKKTLPQREMDAKLAEKILKRNQNRHKRAKRRRDEKRLQNENATPTKPVQELGTLSLSLSLSQAQKRKRRLKRSKERTKEEALKQSGGWYMVPGTLGP